MGKEDTIEILSLLKDIKGNLKIIERHDIRNTYNNSSSTLGIVKANNSLINTTNENIKILNHNIDLLNETFNKTISEAVNHIGEYNYENFNTLNKSIKELEQNISKSDNNKIKSLIKEKIESLDKNEQEELFNEKVKDLKKLIYYL